MAQSAAAYARCRLAVGTIAALNGLFLFIDSLLPVYGLGVNPDLFLNSFLFAVVSLFLSVVTGIAHDLQRGGELGHSRA